MLKEWSCIWWTELCIQPTLRRSVNSYFGCVAPSMEHTPPVADAWTHMQMKSVCNRSPSFLEQIRLSLSSCSWRYSWMHSNHTIVISKKKIVRQGAFSQFFFNCHIWPNIRLTSNHIESGTFWRALAHSNCQSLNAWLQLWLRTNQHTLSISPAHEFGRMCVLCLWIAREWTDTIQWWRIAECLQILCLLCVDCVPPPFAQVCVVWGRAALGTHNGRERTSDGGCNTWRR